MVQVALERAGQEAVIERVVHLAQRHGIPHLPSVRRPVMDVGGVQLLLLPGVLRFAGGAGQQGDRPIDSAGKLQRQRQVAALVDEDIPGLDRNGRVGLVAQQGAADRQPPLPVHQQAGPQQDDRHSRDGGGSDGRPLGHDRVQVQRPGALIGFLLQGGHQIRLHAVLGHGLGIAAGELHDGPHALAQLRKASLDLASRPRAAPPQQRAEQPHGNNS